MPCASTLNSNTEYMVINVALRGKMWGLQGGSENRASPVGAFYVLTLSFWEVSSPHLHRRTIMPGVAVNGVTHAKCWYSARSPVNPSKSSTTNDAVAKIKWDKLYV